MKLSELRTILENAGPRDAEQYQSHEQDDWKKAATSAYGDIRKHDDGTLSSHDESGKRIGAFHKDSGGWHK